MTRDQIISLYTSTNRKFEAAFMPPVKRVLDTVVKDTIEKVRLHGIQYAINNLNLSVGSEPLHDIVKRLYTTVGLRHARINQQRLSQEKNIHVNIEQKRLGFSDVWTNFIINYLQKFLTSKITFEVSNTLRNRLLEVLNEGATLGYSIDDMVNRLKDADLTSFQAARIVRTEVNRAANVGARAQADTFEYQLQKEWISIRDSRTRGQHLSDHASHIGLDGVTIDMEDSFIDPRNQDRLQQPGDPNASAESVVNCRCALGTKAKRDRNGRLIPKRTRVTVIYPSQIRRPQTVVI